MRIGPKSAFTSLCVSLALALTLSGAAMAGPTCQDRQGTTVRCGGPTAMPVGWRLPDSERAALPADEAPPERIVGAFTLVVCLFALIALMPPFDGRRDADWGAEEED